MSEYNDGTKFVCVIRIHETVYLDHDQVCGDVGAMTKCVGMYGATTKCLGMYGATTKCVGIYGATGP